MKIKDVLYIIVIVSAILITLAATAKHEGEWLLFGEESAVRSEDVSAVTKRFYPADPKNKKSVPGYAIVIHAGGSEFIDVKENAPARDLRYLEVVKLLGIVR